ncbi:MAG: hypothetical protein HC836_47405 [Richelia sp. RM2_1_2]|nr:hypothetical protein [Richelia sp. RM2_1_2]
MRLTEHIQNNKDRLQQYFTTKQIDINQLNVGIQILEDFEKAVRLHDFNLRCAELDKQHAEQKLEQYKNRSFWQKLKGLFKND